MILASKLGAVSLAVALAGAAIAGPVVVRSTGPSARAYPAGRQLPDTAQVALKAGDSIVLLDSRGTRTLTGPGNFPAVATGARVSTTQTAARILANQSSSERRGGAVRGGGAAPSQRSPNLWYLDVSKGGTVCVADANAVRIWRQSGATPTDVKIAAASGKGSVAMPQGATVADWPKALPVTDGAEYSVSLGDAPAQKIRFVTVPMPVTLEDTAAQLIAKGCNTQLDLLIASTTPATPG